MRPEKSLAPRLRRLTLLLTACMGLACGGGGSPAADPTPAPPPAASADVRLLMMGNSHTSLNALPQQLEALLRSRLTGGKTVATTVAPGWMFLDERLSDSASMNLLRGQTWSVVVLQAQKYSTSGQFSYPTQQAEELIRTARASGATPVLFPEWPRRGVAETARIYDLHVSIAQKEAACVAPVGQAWDLALQRFPDLVLHDADGNHSSPAGAFLSALVLYATITGASPLGLPAQANGPDAAVQARLRQVAADTVLAIPPRQHCPGQTPING